MSSKTNEYTVYGLLDGINRRLRTLYTEYNEECLIHQPDFAVERLKSMESKYVKGHDRAVRSIKKFIRNYLAKLYKRVSHTEIVDRLTAVCINRDLTMTYRATYGTVVFVNCDNCVTFSMIELVTTSGIVKLFIPKVDPANVRLAMHGNRI